MFIITVHQLTDALLLEEKAKQVEPEFRLIPVPRAISSSCGLAGKSNLDLDQIKKILNQNKIEPDGIYEQEGANYQKVD